jgi:hypothetical protein
MIPNDYGASIAELLKSGRYTQVPSGKGMMSEMGSFRQLRFLLGAIDAILVRRHCVNDFYLKTLEGSAHAECWVQFNSKVW